MRKRILWLFVSMVMVASLVLASCTASTPTTEKPTTPTTPTKPTTPTTPTTPTAPISPGAETAKIKLTKLDGTVIEKTMEKPKYGGTLSVGMGTGSLLIFDDIRMQVYFAATMFLTNENLIMGDWTRGPTGTNEAGFHDLANYPMPVLTGQLAESWEITGPNSMVFHIRKGVHFHNKPPTNGREMDANDVAFSLNRLWEFPGSYQYNSGPPDQYLESIEATDKWTVVMKTKPGKLGRMYELAGQYAKVVPHEAIEKYGNLDDWRNSVGTGPFMLVDYVPESSARFVRNPNYWMNDPFFPENQLPYLDNVKYLVIPDTSTRLAALRTAKIDWLGGYAEYITWEDMLNLNETNPELMWAEYPNGATDAIFMRVDKPELPIHDVRVRKALALAIDNEEIAEYFYGGMAEIYAWPAVPVAEFSDIFVPLDKLPESASEQFTYNPEKAKQLLAEAGYPDGFKTEILTTTQWIDLLSIIKDYWAQIGVDLEFDVRETGATYSILFQRAHKEMFMYTVQPINPFSFLRTKPEAAYNASMIDDPRMNEVIRQCDENYFNWDKKAQIYRDSVAYQLEQQWIIQLPAPNKNVAWYPWVKGYSGEICAGLTANHRDWAKYAWIDQDLKAEYMEKK